MVSRVGKKAIYFLYSVYVKMNCLPELNYNINIQERTQNVVCEIRIILWVSAGE